MTTVFQCVCIAFRLGYGFKVELRLGLAVWVTVVDKMEYVDRTQYAENCRRIFITFILGLYRFCDNE